MSTKKKTKTVAMRNPKYRPLKNRSFKKMSDETNKAPANIEELLSTHLPNTPLIIPDWSKCVSSFENCGVAIFDKSILPRRE